ncbi:MAG: glycerate kinase [Clostridia bacterium]|nr:glycerate kinase [Clostridia bacterium]
MLNTRGGLRVLIAMDSFKGSLTSMEAGNAAKQGVLAACPQAEVTVRPAADGGEGTTDALCFGHQTGYERITVTGPLGEPAACGYYVIRESGTAIIEMAAAAGLTLVPEERRDPLYTTTYGVGEMILDAIGKGCRRFIVGIGGSATNDGGAGMLQALGFDLCDRAGRPIRYGAAGLRELDRIGTERVHPALKECVFRVACDVTNPLCGKQGCSAVFGPQKGATDEMTADMDRWLRRYAGKMREVFPHADPDIPGAGAAGGIGFAFVTCLNARLEKGSEIVLAETGLENDVRNADLVITGEGRMDGQSIMGKTPVGVAALAKKYGKPVIALCGCASEDADKCFDHGIDAYFPVLRDICTREEAMRPGNAAGNITGTVTRIFRLLNAVSAQEQPATM